jgi:hypothetical protein
LLHEPDELRGEFGLVLHIAVSANWISAEDKTHTWMFGTP